MTRTEALERLLGQIAVSCDMLANFAAHAVEHCDGEAAYSMHMVQSMAERIGAAAALPLGRDAMVPTAQHLVGFDLAQALGGEDGRDGSAAQDEGSDPG